MIRDHYIITGNKFFRAGRSFWNGKFAEHAGVATIYPDDNLLWIDLAEDTPLERFKTAENFEAQSKGLPRWKATRYAVVEGVNNVDPDDHSCILDYALLLYDCQTGERLIDVMTLEPVAGRESEVEQLRRSIEPIISGKSPGLHVMRFGDVPD